MTPGAPQSRIGPAANSSLVIKGELTGGEDVLLEGRVEGTISFPGYLVTIGTQAKISADVVAKAVIIQGSLSGNVTASERCEINAGGSMNGDLVSPKIVLVEGSEFQGRVDMPRSVDLRTQ